MAIKESLIFLVLLYALYRIIKYRIAKKLQTSPSPPAPSIHAHGHITRTPAANVLFIGIDGVMHPGTSGGFSFLPLFEAIMRKFSDVDIVICSDWRFNESLEQLRQYFSNDIAGRIIGLTPRCQDATRYHEIQDFCQYYGIQRWRVLDDLTDQYPQNCDGLIATDFYRGLDEDAAVMLDKQLATLVG